MAKTVHGHFREGRFVPRDGDTIPDGVEVEVAIIGVAAEVANNKAEKQLEALERLVAAKMSQ